MGHISITNQAGTVATVEIEGVIGVPEAWQFDRPEGRVATYETFRSTVEQLRGLDSAEIIVNIRSTGGNVNDALLIYDALRSLDARITTRCYGYTASAATIIAQAASEGCREISANSLYLVHRAECQAEGNSDEIARTTELLRRTDMRIAEIYAERAGGDAAEYAALMNENNGRGRWLSPEEAVALALADRITDATPIPQSAAMEAVNLGLASIPGWRGEMPEQSSKRRNAILERIGFKSKTTNARQAAEPAHDTTGYLNEIATLRDRISTLESENARMAAKATATKPKEDPSMHDAKRSVNESAYHEDVKRIQTLG